MYKIAICDDSQSDIDYLKKIIEMTDIIDKKELRIYPFLSGEQLCFSEWKTYDLVIMDMKLGGPDKMSGYEAAMKLREIDENFLLVFCSGSVRPFSDSYKARAYRYWQKEVIGDCTIDEMKEVMQELKRRKEMPGILCNISSKEMVMVYPQSIFYVSKVRNGSEVHITEELAEQYSTSVLRCSMDLNNIQETFENVDAFIRPHDSYIVNMSYIVSVGKNEMRLVNNEILTYSKSKARDFKQAFIWYTASKY